jgi:uncharacterized Zn-binding protein involved in type VI secretion
MNVPALYTPLDMTTGHGPWPPVGYAPPPVGASANVFLNRKQVHKVGDQTLPHFHLPPDVHTDVISTGSVSVFINKKPMAVVGSLLMSRFGPAGQVAAFGATSVFVDNRGGS